MLEHVKVGERAELMLSDELLQKVKQAREDAARAAFERAERRRARAWLARLRRGFEMMGSEDFS